MKKAIVLVLSVVIVGGIFLGISALTQNEDSEGVVIEEERESEPKGRNLSVELDEKMGFAAP